MCGSSSTSKGKGKGKGAISSFGGYTFGHGVGSTADQRRAENKAAMSQGTNVSNSPGFNGKSSSLGGPQAGEVVVASVEKPGVLMKHAPVGPGMAPRQHTSITLAGMEDEIADGQVVNARDYVNADYASRNIMSREMYNEGVKLGKDITETERMMSPFGHFKREPGTNPLSRMNSSFVADRHIGQRAYDAMLDRKRVVPMRRAVDLYRSGVPKGATQNRAEIAAENLSEGNFQYENGKLAPDRIGMGMDVLNGVRGLFSLNPIGFANVLTAYDTLADYHSFFGTSNKTPSASNPSNQQMTGLRGGKGNVGLMKNGDLNEMTADLVWDAKTQTTKYIKRGMAPNQPKESRKPRRGKSLLNKTGADGVDYRAPVLMQKLWG
ncbi:hypothetical protein GO013_07310 [Pseudodesulfovibrio sp. JC047]|uniref:hypothetical protein n=1 Tax=Pseudodesulfovibrio sp. JC047 TaxID=2683199 RepID=UPI0013D22879|nr:hypothetical protein [Pseudodesulfovibrio sp. JC047]NDV19226.1 hypothetical protein [Pseudodesulfovibrio sp. JC047]